MKKLISFVIVLAMLALPAAGLAGGAKKPVLLFETGSVTPETVSGGEDIELTVCLKNYGAAEARFVRISADSSDESIELVSDLNGVFLESLPAGESMELVFRFRSALHAKIGDYRLSVRAVCEDKNGMGSTAEAEYRMHVEQEVFVSAIMPELPSPAVSGSSFSHSVLIYNPSDAAAYNISVRLSVDGFIAGSAFISRMEPGGSEEKEIKIFVTELSGGKKYGDTSGELIITYEDGGGNEKMLSLNVSCSVAAPENGLTREEQERLEQEKIKEQTLSKWWISALAAFAVIAVLVSLLIISRLARLIKIK